MDRQMFKKTVEMLFYFIVKSILEFVMACNVLWNFENLLFMHENGK